MKIAIIYASFYIKGGSENVILWLTEELLRRGHAVTIFTSEYNHADPDLPETVKPCMVEISAGGNYSTFIDWLWAGWRLRKRLQHFDIVNPHNFPANVWVAFARRFSPIFPPVLWFCQEPARTLYEPGHHVQRGHYPSVSRHIITKIRQDGLPALIKAAQKSLFYLLTTLFRDALRTTHIRLDQQAARTCQGIMANSHYMAANIQKRYHCAVVACPLGVRVSENASAVLVAKQPYFLTVTRLEAAKHVDTIIAAVHQLIQEGVLADVALRIVGSGSQESVLKQRVHELGLEKQISFTGYISDAQLDQYYREALAVIYVPEDEPFGLVPVEAMLRRTAVIVSNTGGTAETVRDQVTGLHVPPGQVEPLAAAMRTFLQNRELAVQFGENGYQHVMQHFTFAHFVDRFEQALQILTKGDA